jgi:hypothetical protein
MHYSKRERSRADCLTLVRWNELGNSSCFVQAQNCKKCLLLQRKTSTHHVPYANYYVCQAKKIIGDHWFISKTCYYLFSCFFYCVYYFLLSSDVTWWNLYMSVAMHGQSTSKS